MSELDVVDIFALYFNQLSNSVEYLFCSIIDNHKSSIWYAKDGRVFEKNLSKTIKTVHLDSNLPFADIRIKLGQASLVSWIQ